MKILVGRVGTAISLRLLMFPLIWLASTVIPTFGQPRPQAASDVKPASLFSAPEVDAGFHELYELRLAKAREQFAMWKAKHPDDPL